MKLVYAHEMGALDKKAEEENEMLKGCILEMSETVYQ